MEQVILFSESDPGYQIFCLPVFLKHGISDAQISVLQTLAAIAKANSNNLSSASQILQKTGVPKFSKSDIRTRESEKTPDIETFTERHKLSD